MRRSLRKRPQWKLGTLEERYEDWHLDIRHRGEPKKRTQGNGESRKKLATARTRMTLRDIPSLRKGHGKDKAVPRTQNKRIFGKRRHQTGRQQWNKGPRLKAATTSEEG
jgi:hypothetical protein